MPLLLESVNTLYSASLTPAQGWATSAQAHIVGPAGSLDFPLAGAALPRVAVLLDDGDLFVIDRDWMALYDHDADGARLWIQPAPLLLDADTLVWTRQGGTLLLLQADGARWLPIALSSGEMQAAVALPRADVPEPLLLAAQDAPLREAFHLTSSALRLDASLVGGWVRLVHILQEQGRHDPALSSVHAARALNPPPPVDTPEWLVYRQLYLLEAGSERALGSTIGAEHSLRDGLALAPGDTLLTLALAELMLETGRSQEAEQVLSDWQGSHSDRIVIVGDVYARHGQWEAAARQYRAAWLGLGDPLLASLLVDVLCTSGDLDEALRVRRRQLRQWQVLGADADTLTTLEEDIQRLEDTLQGEPISAVQ